MSHRLRSVGACAGVALLAALPAGARQLVRPEDVIVALFSLQTQLDVDTRVLQRMEVRQEDNRRSRAVALEKV